MAAFLAANALMSGCATRYFTSDPALREPSGAIVPAEPVAPRTLAMFEGSTGRSLGWSDVMAAASWADAVFIGERHDDPVAHRVQLAIFEDLASGYPGTALALEHLERNEQPTVDAYLRGEIGVDPFIDTTGSRNWAGKDTWVRFFQPLVDCARENQSPVIAANAPRDAVREAREIGHEGMRAKPADEQKNFDLPITEREGLGARDWNERWSAYFERFVEIMSPADDADPAATRERLRSLFLSQSTWDGTMGASAASALSHGAPKVVLCAGCFHIERDGGTVLQFEARKPRAKVLTVTVIDQSSPALREADRGAADIVIYGFPVDRPKPEAGKTDETPSDVGKDAGKDAGKDEAPSPSSSNNPADNPASPAGSAPTPSSQDPQAPAGKPANQ